MWVKIFHSTYFQWLSSLTLSILIVSLFTTHREARTEAKLDRLETLMISGFNNTNQWQKRQDSINLANAEIQKYVPRITIAPGARVTSSFGMRDSVKHWGIDIANKKGSPILAYASGKVIKAKYSGRYGKLTIIDTGLFYLRIAHQDSIFVKEGQLIAQGDLIGTVGNTGNSTGCHEHIEIIQKYVEGLLKNQYRDPIIFYQ
jgi:murein DD-endopeptidase MepM/ murein hydrolase activator NlpD